MTFPLAERFDARCRSSVGDKYFGSSLPERLGESAAGRLIGDEAIDLVPLRENGKRALLEFRMIRDDDRFRGTLDHRAVNGAGLVVGVVDAARADARPAAVGPV